MKKLFSLTVCVGLIALTNGCSGTGRSCFSNPFAGRSIGNYFRGAECSTCNPPAGQSVGYGTNVAPLCATCATNAGANSGVVSGSATLPYGTLDLNGPETSNSRVEAARPAYDNIGSGPDDNGTSPPAEFISRSGN